MPGVEDFGIVPVEAQACGAPVLATGAGGALDSVVPGRTGALVDLGQAGLIERWTDALRTFDPSRYQTAAIRRHAEGFSARTFQTRMREIIEKTAA
jgi:glycosyltransferase involved in cell wall biosynthesis